MTGCEQRIEFKTITDYWTQFFIKTSKEKKWKSNSVCRCGSIMKQGIPDEDDHMRAICTQCGFIHYLNPKMVVGCIPQWGDQILLCRRNIEPGKGKWTLPAGLS